MRITSGCATLLAAMALASSANGTVALQSHAFTCKNFSGTRCSSWSHATTVRTPFGNYLHLPHLNYMLNLTCQFEAHLSLGELLETAQRDGVNELVQQEAPKRVHHKARFSSLMASFKDALSRTANVLSKSFRISDINSIPPFVPSTPPNTPILSPPELYGEGPSSVLTPFETVPSSPSFRSHDESAPHPVWLPSISAYRSPSVPIATGSTLVLHDLEIALQTRMPTNTVEWFNNEPSFSPLIQPPNTPIAPSAEMSQSYHSLSRRSTHNSSADSDTHTSLLLAAEIDFYLPGTELMPSPSKQSDYMSTFPSEYLFNTQHNPNPAVHLFSARGLHSTFNARQLAYLDMCLKYVE
jgi:hypothetical protein